MDDDKTALPPPAESDDRTVLPSGPRTDGGAGLTGHVMALPVGARLDEFEITGVIGEGGFGIVYAAHDHSLDRDVAVKEYMPGSLAMRTQGFTVSVRSERYIETFQTGLRSFVNEAKLLARFDHPSLVKVYRFWEAHGTAYMVMPHYRGLTLKAQLKQHAEPPDEAWLRTILGELLEALDVIHRENCFHRDVAPDNILLVEAERAVLLDFGAARRVIGDLTHGLTVILKPGYAPVEQYAEVKAMKQGPWTDIYSLAATMYFAIAGRAPEPSVGRMMSDTLAPASEIGRGRYSAGFLAALDAALRVRPDERPQSVAAFAALLAASSAAPIGSSAPLAPRVARAALAGMPAPSTPWLGYGVAATGAALLIGAAAYAWLGLRGEPTPPAEPIPVATPAPPAAEPPVEPRAVATPVPSPAPAPAPVTEPPVAGPPPGPAHSSPPVAAPVVDRPVTTPAPPPVTKPAANVAVREPPRAPTPGPKPPTPSVVVPAPPAARDNAEVAALLARAEQTLARREFRRAAGLAENVLALEPANSRALEIRRRARDGESKAFDEIKIE